MAKFTLARLFEAAARRVPNLPITIDPLLRTEAETGAGLGLPGSINDLVRSLVTITPAGADVQEHVLPQSRQPLSLPEDVALVTHTSGTTSGYPVAGGYPKLVGYPESA